MNKPSTEPDMVHKALVPYGFVDGKYGELPFTLRHTGFTHKLSPPGGGHYHVEIDGRTIAEVVPQRDGTYTVVMQIDVWLRGAKPMDPDMMAAIARRAEALGSRFNEQ